MKNILRVIPTYEVINVLESHLSTSEAAGILLDLLIQELWVKDSDVIYLEDFWKEKLNERANN